MSFESENKNVEKIIVSNKTYYLVGTSHISENSVKLVKEVIERVQPDTVSIELDKKRYEKYTNSNQWGNTDIIKIIKEKKLVVLISNIVYSAYQKKLANTKGTTQAGELIQAIKSAKEIGANIQLIDRDIQVTFKRMWRHLSFLEKPKLFMTFFTEFDDIEQDKLEEYLESDSFDKVFISLSKKYPSLYQDMITDRDKYMSTKLKNNSSQVNVVVVGKAHMKGIKEKLEKRTEFSLDNLNEIPPKKLSTKLLEFSLPAIIIILLVLSLVSGFEVGVSQILKWLVWNGGLAALFTCFALANPLTILTSFIMAPVGALSPVLSVGMFSALMEASIKKPTVNDFMNAQDDISSINSIYKNRLLKVGLIFVLASAGGAIGNIIGGIELFKNLI